MRFCPQCATELQTADRGGRARSVCPDSKCGYVNWNNPAPVVAAVAERDGGIVLVQSHGWPRKWFGLITGFLEQGEMPEAAVLREVKEEIGLEATLENYIGMYPFYEMNQLILAYHVRVAAGPIVLDETELRDYREIAIQDARPWRMGTGLALKDWLMSQGYEREFLQL